MLLVLQVPLVLLTFSCPQRLAQFLRLLYAATISRLTKPVHFGRFHVHRSQQPASPHPKPRPRPISMPTSTYLRLYPWSPRGSRCSSQSCCCVTQTLHSVAHPSSRVHLQVPLIACHVSHDGTRTRGTALAQPSHLGRHLCLGRISASSPAVEG